MTKAKSNVVSDLNPNGGALPASPKKVKSGKTGKTRKTSKTSPPVTKGLFTNNKRWAENLGITTTLVVLAIALGFTVPQF